MTSQYWDGEEGIVVIPCYQTTKYLEFIPREQGGGFQGEIPANDPILTKAKREDRRDTSKRQRTGQVRPTLLLGSRRGWFVSTCGG